MRKYTNKAGLDPELHFRCQDPAKLGQVFHMVCNLIVFRHQSSLQEGEVRTKFPYLTRRRFPHDWAISEMVKGYLAGIRKNLRRKEKEDEDEDDDKGEAEANEGEAEADEGEAEAGEGEEDEEEDNDENEMEAGEGEEDGDVEDWLASPLQNVQCTVKTSPPPPTRKPSDSDEDASDNENWPPLAISRSTSKRAAQVNSKRPNNSKNTHQQPPKKKRCVSVSNEDNRLSHSSQTCPSGSHTNRSAAASSSSLRN